MLTLLLSSTKSDLASVLLDPAVPTTGGGGVRSDHVELRPRAHTDHENRNNRTTVEIRSSSDHLELPGGSGRGLHQVLSRTSTGPGVEQQGLHQPLRTRISVTGHGGQAMTQIDLSDDEDQVPNMTEQGQKKLSFKTTTAITKYVLADYYYLFY